MKVKGFSVNLCHIDRIGAGVSVACAIHCALIRVATTMLSFLGLGFLVDERSELPFLAGSIALASASICWGIRIHRQRRLLILFGAALFLIIAGRKASDESLEPLMVATGVLLLVSGHLLNRHWCNSCARCEGDSRSHCSGAL